MKKLISLLLAAAALTAPCSAFAKDYSNYPQRFWDLPKEHWAYAAVYELTDKNIINGYDDGSFGPNHTVTRAEWAKMMVSALDIPIKQPDSNDVYDLSSGDWFYLYVCSSKQYMNFYTIDGKKYFKPNQTASREDVTVSLVKMKGYDVENTDYSYLNKFNDLDSISNNLKKYVSVAVEKKLIDGFDDGTFRGQDTLTRAEAATLLCRAFQTGTDNKVTSTQKPTPTPIPPTPVPTNAPTQRPTSTPRPTQGGMVIINVTPTPTAKPTESPSKNPAEQPTRTPTATPTDEPTAAPTQKPTPQPTADPTAVPAKSNYIDTLCDADLSVKFKIDSSYKDVYHIFNGDNCLYYIDKSNNIYKLTPGGKTKIANLDNMQISYDGKTYIIKDLISLYYDKKSKTLMALANMKSTGYLKTENLDGVTFSVPDCLYKGKSSEKPIGVSPLSCDKESFILGTLNNGNILLSHAIQAYYNGIFIADDLKYSNLFKLTFSKTVNGYTTNDDWPGTWVTYAEAGGNVYFCTKAHLLKYNYKQCVEVTPISDYNAHMVTKNGVYLMNSSGITKTDFNGRIQGTLKYDNIDIDDCKPFNINSVYPILYQCEDNNIIFYDMQNNCFRTIHTSL